MHLGGYIFLMVFCDTLRALRGYVNSDEFGGVAFCG